MPGSSVIAKNNNVQGVGNAGQVQNSSGLNKLDKPTISNKMLGIVHQHRLDNVKAFVHARGGNQGVKDAAGLLERVANPKIVKQYEALFGKDSSLLKMAADLNKNRANSQHLQNTENIHKAKYLNSFARPLQEFKDALKLADGAPEVGENFDAHRKDLLIKCQTLHNTAESMPDTPEGKQMKALCISLAKVCAQKSQLIEKNQKILDNLIPYDPAIDKITQKMDVLVTKMEQTSKISEGYTDLLLNTSLSENDKIVLNNKLISSSNHLASLSEQRNELAAQHHHLNEAQSEQEKKIVQLHPKLQEMADTKLALEDPHSAQQNLLQKQELLDEFEVLEELEELEKLQLQESLEHEVAASHSPAVANTNTNLNAEQNIVQANSAAPNSAAPTNSVPVKTVAESALLHENDLALKSYSSALDLLNVNIANLYASGKTKEALILIICREKLRASLNDQTEKAKNDNQTNAVKNVLPGGQKKLGLISRIRVKFQAKAALNLGKNYKPFNPTLTKLDAKTTLAAYLQGAFKQAGLSGADVPSKAALREALQQGISNPRNYADFGKVDPSIQQAAANANSNVAQQVTNPPEEHPIQINALQEAFVDKAKQFDSKASSSYAKLMIKSKPEVFLQKALVQDLFLARQQATKLLMNDATPNKETHKSNRDLIDSAIKKRLVASELAVSNLYLDKDPFVLGNGRLISTSEILEGLERKNHLKNLADSRVFTDMNALDAAANVYLATNNGPAYGVLNNNGHWVTVIASKNANGVVNTYSADTLNLQADGNKGLPNACGPLQILMHEELSKRLVANPGADAIQTMKDIEADLQALGKDTLRSVVLQQRLESLDQVIKNLPPPSPVTATTGYAQQIDGMAEAFNF